MALETLLGALTSLPAFADLRSRLAAGERTVAPGLGRAARLPVAAALFGDLARPFLLITDRADRAFSLADELALWIPQAHPILFPEPNPLFYENETWGRSTRRDRLLALTRLAAYHLPGSGSKIGDPDSHYPFLVSSARAIMGRTLPRRAFIKGTRLLEAGQEHNPDSLIRAWVTMGYEPVNTVVAPGQFARRGGILDIWPPADEQPARLDFFGDEIETLRRFDATTQRTIPIGAAVPLKRLQVSPAREFLASEPDIELPPSEFDLPLLHSAVASLIDYLPAESIVLIDNWEAFEETIHELEEQALTLRVDALEDGRIAEDFPLPYLTWDQIQDSLAGHRIVKLGPKLPEADLPLAQAFSPNPRFGGQLKPLLDYLSQIHQQREPITIVSRQADRLRHLWEERRLGGDRSTGA